MIRLETKKCCSSANYGLIELSGLNKSACNLDEYFQIKIFDMKFELINVLIFDTVLIFLVLIFQCFV